jgi:hypothetical protein
VWVYDANCKIEAALKHLLPTLVFLSACTNGPQSVVAPDTQEVAGPADGASIPDTAAPPLDLMPAADTAVSPIPDVPVVADIDASTEADEGRELPEPEPDIEEIVEPEPQPQLLLGAVTDGQFAAFTGGQDVEIVQGPQGGIHATVVLELQHTTLTLVGGKALVGMECATRVDQELVGLITVSTYKLQVLSGTHFMSPEITVFFVQDVADPYVDKVAEISCKVTHQGTALQSAVMVLLKDGV